MSPLLRRLAIPCLPAVLVVLAEPALVAAHDTASLQPPGGGEEPRGEARLVAK